MTTPKPRPALRRADDAEVHPALALAPSQAPPFRTRSEPPAAPTKGSEKTKGKAGKQQRGKREPTQDRTAAGASRFRSAGHATSDTVLPKKLVPLEVRVPKATRKQLRAVAKLSGTSVDELVATALHEWLGDPRTW